MWNKLHFDFTFFFLIKKLIFFIIKILIIKKRIFYLKILFSLKLFLFLSEISNRAISKTKQLMGSLFSHFSKQNSTKDFRILMVGLDASGKTTILHKWMKTDEMITNPTECYNVNTITIKIHKS
jgi:hypothetical protein